MTLLQNHDFQLHELLSYHSIKASRNNFIAGMHMLGLLYHMYGIGMHIYSSQVHNSQDMQFTST